MNIIILDPFQLRTVVLSSILLVLVAGTRNDAESLNLFDTQIEREERGSCLSQPDHPVEDVGTILVTRVLILLHGVGVSGIKRGTDFLKGHGRMD